MPILIDTNVLLRSVQPSHPMHQTAVRALEILMNGEEALNAAWKTLLLVNRVRGFQVHDARLVAVMKTYGVKT